MNVRCGHCRGTHENLAEARECSRAWWAARNGQSAPEAPAPEPAVKPEAPAQEALEPGFYSSGPKVYRLSADGAWSLLASNGRWMEGARAPYRPWRMSVEEVAAKGRILVRCIVCGTRLTKRASREAGIGPVCATKI
jgi:hypothetical protein